MIITAPIRCPWNWHRRPIALLVQEEKRDSWRVRRRGQRGRGQKTEEKVTKRGKSTEYSQNMEFYNLFRYSNFVFGG